MTFSLIQEFKRFKHTEVRKLIQNLKICYCETNLAQNLLNMHIDPRGRPQSRPVVITIFTHVVRPSPLFKIDQNKTDLHCRPVLWTGRVDH